VDVPLNAVHEIVLAIGATSCRGRTSVTFVGLPGLATMVVARSRARRLGETRPHGRQEQPYLLLMSWRAEKCR
jgi:hypothetical protein